MVQARLAGNAAQRKAGWAAQPSLLAGILFGGEGDRMTPSHTVKKGTRYRYYVSPMAGLRTPSTLRGCLGASDH
jgi:site-specific DNA recombinase